jgi:hypothetical protein
MRNIIVSVLASALAVAAFVQAEAPPPQVVVGGDQAVAVVRDVVAQADGSVSGVVANTSTRALRDVRLMIAHEWLWKNEFHPGADDPGRAVEYTIPGEIPPGGQMRFTTPPEPLPSRSDGYFRPRVDVVSLTQIG